ncbi:MAG TPA: hypothetical protein VN956_19230 [Pyrinomonadaceae bacterium]|nr:hypothetical protein [Pyrinomonadaceae bacterium]
MSKTNGRGHGVSVDVIEPAAPDEAQSFYDPTNPILAAPKAEPKSNKGWKRKLIGWSFVLLLIVGGGFALYLLLRANRVNVKVQADARRETNNEKSQPSPGGSENVLSSEAIQIARQAMGADRLGSANPNPSPNPSPTASPSPIGNVQRLTFTDSSPAYAHQNDAGSTNGNGTQNNQGDSKTSAQPALTSEVAAQIAQTRANATQSLFVDDAPQRQLLVQPATSRGLHRPTNNEVGATALTKEPSAVLPPFGTMLPVRTQGVIFSLRNNSYARLELSRDCQGEGWSLSKGTLLIGRVSGSENDRAYVNIVGFIDPKSNRFVKMTGEVLGSDGGSGMAGKRVAIDRNHLKQTLSKVASSGLQVAGMMAGALTGRGTVVVNGAGYRLLNPITDEAGRIVGSSDDKRSFVKVEAGQSAYVMVADLPKESRAVDAPGEDELTRAATSLNDREVMELILLGTPDEIRAALPLMSGEKKQLVIKSIGMESQKP